MDLSWLAAWLDSANTFFQYIWDFMASGIYQLAAAKTERNT
ncbi:hypothetical protein [Pseudomonas avellanae]|nr:hypothetical protein [Pseudomonas avellanae]GGJ53963.1 hypothetical protein GCM10009085_54110 [Pseudomonas avellanae]